MKSNNKLSVQRLNVRKDFYGRSFAPRTWNQLPAVEVCWLLSSDTEAGSSHMTGAVGGGRVDVWSGLSGSICTTHTVQLFAGSMRRGSGGCLLSPDYMPLLGPCSSRGLTDTSR